MVYPSTHLISHSLFTQAIAHCGNFTLLFLDGYQQSRIIPALKQQLKTEDSSPK
ncbi:hypothetical protein N0Y54_18430 [Nostoc punctiforme UO1]|uniref:hypothetical protein n=1 Tax=Nostoc punctiforme TaxID=272131 RepID=UPI0030B1218E